MASIRFSFALCLFASFAAACGDSDDQEGQDAAVRRDLGVMTDGGALPDATTFPDATTNPDAATNPDAETFPDATVNPDAEIFPDATVNPDADTFPDATDPDAETFPDAAEPDADLADSNFADADIFPDADLEDSGEIEDSGIVTPADAGGGDAGTTVTQGGGLVITAINVVGVEWITLHNTGTSTISITDYDFLAASHPNQVIPLRTVSDPTGTSGDIFEIFPGQYANGYLNDTNIPKDAAFLIGDPGQIVDAFADVGDAISFVGPGNLGDSLDFRDVATDPTLPMTATQFPLIAGLPLMLDLAADGPGGELANDAGAAWCTTVYELFSNGIGPSEGCRIFRINEFLYDYDSVGSGTDDGQEFIEITGPAGASLAGLIVTRIEGTGATAGAVDQEIAITGLRMPLNGIYVVADDVTTGGPTLVPNADQVTNFAMENGPDALQLILLDAAPVLMDSVAYGAVTAMVDTLRSLAIVEQFPLEDLAVTSYSANFARSLEMLDGGSNANDYRYDPSPTPGEVNGVSLFEFLSLSPTNAHAIPGHSVSVLLTGVDFTDLMTINFGPGPQPTVSCTAPLIPNTLPCTFTYPVAAPAVAAHVEMALSARPGAGGSLAIPSGFTWTLPNNETNTSAECDFCNIQFPATLTGSPGVETSRIYGQIYEAGLTDTTSGGPAPNILAEAGYGPQGTDPRAVDWIWFESEFNVEVGNNDEYQARLIAPAVGTYSYAYRYSLDGGLTWSYADSDGAGSNGGLDFNAAQVGILTVQ
jgi:hypothetical protein